MNIVREQSGDLHGALVTRWPGCEHFDGRLVCALVPCIAPWVSVSLTRLCALIRNEKCSRGESHALAFSLSLYISLSLSLSFTYTYSVTQTRSKEPTFGNNLNPVVPT